MVISMTKPTIETVAANLTDALIKNQPIIAPYPNSARAVIDAMIITAAGNSAEGERILDTAAANIACNCDAKVDTSLNINLEVAANNVVDVACEIMRHFPERVMRAKASMT